MSASVQHSSDQEGQIIDGYCRQWAGPILPTAVRGIMNTYWTNVIRFSLTRQEFEREVLVTPLKRAGQPITTTYADCVDEFKTAMKVDCKSANLCVTFKITTPDSAIANLSRVQVFMSLYSPQLKKLMRIVQTLVWDPEQKGMQVCIPYCPIAMLRRMCVAKNKSRKPHKPGDKIFALNMQFAPIASEYAHGPDRVHGYYRRSVRAWGGVKCLLHRPDLVQYYHSHNKGVRLGQREYTSSAFGPWWGSWLPLVDQQICVLKWTGWPQQIEYMCLSAEVRFTMHMDNVKTTVRQRKLLTGPNKAHRHSVGTVFNIGLTSEVVRRAERVTIAYIVNIHTVEDGQERVIVPTDTGLLRSCHIADADKRGHLQRCHIGPQLWRL